MATHIVGGEIYYDYLGNNDYKISMKVYRDAINGVPPFDDPAIMTIFDRNGNVITAFSVVLSSSLTVPPTNNSPCAPAVEGSVGVEEAYYETVINLPPLLGGYYIAYQRCCRNGTILNLVNPGAVGTTYWEHIPGPEQAPINSSPRFVNRPPIYICNNIPISFNHIAFDPDGDSLVYTLCTPFNGLDGCCPTVMTNTYNPNTGSAQCFSSPPFCPNTNSPPPYVSVPFVPPYSASYPMASNPAININSYTGFLDGSPTTLGQWVVGVCVSEYRNGILIGTHHRDFQFNVINCPFVVNPAIEGQSSEFSNPQAGLTGTGFCNGYSITFGDSSSGSITAYLWDFGDPTTLADTSILQNPTYLFPATGDYTVMLVVNPRTNCADTAYKVFHAAPLLKPDFLYPTSMCFNGNNFDFTAAGSFEGTGTFSWNFGAQATPSSSTNTFVPNVHYNAPGTYTVGFTVAENACTATRTKTLQVLQNPQAIIGNINPSGCIPQTITFPNQSTAGTSMVYSWSFSDGSSSTQQSPTITFTNAGIYSASLTVITNQACIDTSKVVAVNSVTVFPTPYSDFKYTSDTKNCITNNSIDFTSTSTFSGTPGSLSWLFGSSATPSVSSNTTVNNVSYNTAGAYTVTLIAEKNGCVDTSEQVIELFNNPFASVSTGSLQGCDPSEFTFNNISTGSSTLNYLWTFSDGITDATKNPKRSFTPPGVYSYTLMVYTTDKCIDTSFYFSVNTITINPTPTASFTANPKITSIFDPEITFTDVSTTPVTVWQYTFGDGSSAITQNPLYSYAAPGNYIVTQTVYNQFNCPNTTALEIIILPEHRFWIPNAFTPGPKDELNTIFKPLIIGAQEYSFYIFDRWGELIFKTNDLNEGWNGTYLNKECKMDVYVWKCDFRNEVTRKEEHHVGHVTLVR